jgi:hypothetical protein
MASHYLAAGQQLRVTADASSTGQLRRLALLPTGGNDVQSATSIAASTSVVVGPFSTVTRWEIVDATGALAYTIGAAPAEGDLTNGGVGTAAGSGVSAAEYGNTVHRTVLTVTDLSVAMTDATTAGCHGSQKVYDFPAGAIQILGASYNLTTLAGAGGIADNAALVGSLGSAAVGTDNATLTSTEADLVASTTGTLSGGAGVLTKHGSVVTTAFDGTTTAIDAYLNLAVPDAGSTADDTITVNGTIELVWVNLGDY